MEPVHVLKTLADINRLRILNLVSQRAMCVCEIETLLELNQSNVSRHLTKLKGCGMINSIKEAQWVHYAMDEEFARENPELRAYVDKIFKQLPICLEDLRKYRTYRQKGFTCRNIYEDKEMVEKTIKLGAGTVSESEGDRNGQ